MPLLMNGCCFQTAHSSGACVQQSFPSLLTGKRGRLRRETSPLSSAFAPFSHQAPPPHTLLPIAQRFNAAPPMPPINPTRPAGVFCSPVPSPTPPSLTFHSVPPIRQCLSCTHFWTFWGMRMQPPAPPGLSAPIRRASPPLISNTRQSQLRAAPDYCDGELPAASSDDERAAAALPSPSPLPRPPPLLLLSLPPPPPSARASAAAPPARRSSASIAPSCSARWRGAASPWKLSAARVTWMLLCAVFATAGEQQHTRQRVFIQKTD